MTRIARSAQRVGTQPSAPRLDHPTVSMELRARSITPRSARARFPVEHFTHGHLRRLVIMSAGSTLIAFVLMRSIGAHEAGAWSLLAGLIEWLPFIGGAFVGPAMATFAAFTCGPASGLAALIALIGFREIVRRLTAAAGSNRGEG